jgi:hypothetical protein
MAHFCSIYKSTGTPPTTRAACHRRHVAVAVGNIVVFLLSLSMSPSQCYRDSDHLRLVISVTGVFVMVGAIFA